MHVEPILILLVEDNPGDVRLIVEALKENKVLHRLTVVRDGAEAVDYLHRVGKHTAAPRPNLILLDLNLPKKDGREVLAEIKADANLQAIPVIILTSSDAEKDILKAYNLNANCYITKPLDFEQFIAAVQSLQDFWLHIVKLPPDGAK